MKMINKYKYIIIHHSLTKDSETVSWSAIKRYHTQKLGWSDIGYHFGIENINGIYETLIGRPLERMGAHTKGMNFISIGICLVGNFDNKKANVAQMLECAKLVKTLCLIFDISFDNVFPHNKFANKSCPGKMFDFQRLIKLVKEKP